ncbi:hypothetical protein CHARACLAT_010010 [Characodon lateralis]|uniref:Secreted protein n=1 Tax=Characodon lateralis TaxID=208331 RepID=A0ABU7EKL6_9TELE|nr:hypothetical protein [Characodon lateralis]
MVMGYAWGLGCSWLSLRVGAPAASSTPCFKNNLPAQLLERRGHGGISGGRLPGGLGHRVKGHIPDRRIHTLIKNSAAVTEPAGG